MSLRLPFLFCMSNIFYILTNPVHDVVVPFLESSLGMVLVCFTLVLFIISAILYLIRR